MQIKHSVTIKVDVNNKVSLIPNQPIDFPTLLQLLHSVIASTAHSVINNTPEKDRQAVKDDIYDMVNITSSRTLELIVPDKELRPDIDADAIEQIIKTQDAALKKQAEFVCQTTPLSEPKEV